MRAHAGSGPLLCVVAVTLLLAGCGAAASATSAPVETAAAADGPPSPDPTATPASGADRTYVSGTMTCRIVGGEEHEEKVRDYTTYRLAIDCVLSMSDERLTGTAHYELAATFIQLEPPVEGASNFWASTTTLEAEGGTWKGTGYGSEFVSDKIRKLTLFTSGTDTLEGQGAFAGLVCRLLWTRETPMGAGIPYTVAGWIEPAD